VRSFAADGYLIVYQYAEPEVVTILHIVAPGRRATPAILSPVLTSAHATIYMFPSHCHVAEY
jgi:hypothetical protein